MHISLMAIVINNYKSSPSSPIAVALIGPSPAGAITGPDESLP
jgi:hypothetical protein